MSALESDLPSLHYRYRPANAPSGLLVARFVPDSALERIGDEWDEIWWNPTSNTFRKEADEELQVSGQDLAERQSASEACG